MVVARPLIRPPETHFLWSYYDVVLRTNYSCTGRHHFHDVIITTPANQKSPSERFLVVEQHEGSELIQVELGRDRQLGVGLMVFAVLSSISGDMFVDWWLIIHACKYVRVRRSREGEEDMAGTLV